MKSITGSFNEAPNYFYSDIFLKILEFCQKGESVQFVGLKGFGKSLLLRNLEQRQLEILKELGIDGQTSIYLSDMDLLSDGSTVTILKNIFGKMLGMDKLIGLDSFGITAELNNFFALLKENNKVAILILDSMEKLETYHNKEVYGFLHALYKQNIDKLRFVFSFERKVDFSRAKDEYGDFGRLMLGNTVYLRRMNLKETEWFMNSLTGNNKADISFTDRKAIQESANGVMFQIKRLFEESLSGADIKKIIENPKLSSGLSYNLEMMFRPLHPEMETMKNIVNNSLSNADEVSLVTLKKYDIVDQKNKFCSVIFENYLREVFDLNTNKYSEEVGDLIIENKLTNSEYKILKFLNASKGKICSREGIINYVWGERANKGISDHALDQIVSRLRKKLNNSSSGVSIETFRGRGFRLS